MENSVSIETENKEDVDYWQKRSEELKAELQKKKSDLLGVNKILKHETLERIEAEKKLFECYKYLGIVNRQLAILLNLGKNGNGKKGKNIIHLILDSAQSLSGANSAAFYNYKESTGELSLASLIGIDETKISKKFSETDCKALKSLFQEKIRVYGKVENRELEKAGLNSKVKYFLALPIIGNEKIIGVLFLGFKNKEIITTQELDFYGAFSMQAAFLIASARHI